MVIGRSFPAILMGAALLTIPTMASGGEPIVIREAPGPSYQLSVLETECHGQRVRVEISNRGLGASTLEGFYIDGESHAADNGELAELTQFLTNARVTFLVGSSCDWPGEILVWVQGLLLERPPGQTDDVLRGFRISY